MLVSLFFHNTGTPVNSWNSPPTWGGRTFQKLSDLERVRGGNFLLEREDKPEKGGLM